MRRNFSPIHDKWHRRVEGQIGHTIGQHPEWFSFKTPHAKADCINSLAKRIVGEIVADSQLAAKTSNRELCCNTRKGNGAEIVPLPGEWVSSYCPLHKSDFLVDVSCGEEAVADDAKLSVRLKQEMSGSLPAISLEGDESTLSPSLKRKVELAVRKYNDPMVANWIMEELDK